MKRPPRRAFLVAKPRKPKGKRPGVTDQQTVHYWWWRFLRRNDGYLQCCETNGKGRLRKLFQEFGDVRGDSFRDWFYEEMPTGETRADYLFGEAPTPFNRPSVVTLKSTAEWDSVYEDHGYLLVAINMREKSRSILKKKFVSWLKSQPEAPNTLSPEQRRKLVDRRRYEYVTVNGKLVRRLRHKGLPKELRLKPLPRKERLTGRRGRPYRRCPWLAWSYHRDC